LTTVFFTDRDLGKRFPDTLANAGLTVERHHDLFPPNGSDEQWLEYVGNNSRIALTHNERIRYTPNELAAVVRHSVGLLVLVGKVPLPALAANFIATLPKTEAFIGTHKPPYIAKIYRASPVELARNPNAPGTITPWYPK
jgi:PIN like domain